uniref:(northern house mosquito) hypothetical protein n=1 Tax=Culex pipiens TaxID=7175 RepID=A0A8D8CY37_CULPI
MQEFHLYRTIQLLKLKYIYKTTTSKSKQKPICEYKVSAKEINTVVMIIKFMNVQSEQSFQPRAANEAHQIKGSNIAGQPARCQKGDKSCHRVLKIGRGHDTVAS